MTLQQRRDAYLRSISRPVPETVPDNQRSADKIHSFSSSLHSGVAKKGVSGVKQASQSRAHYRSLDEQFRALLANVLDIRRKLVRDPGNKVLEALCRKQVAKLQWLGELVASKDNLTRRTVLPDRTYTRTDRLQPIGRTERL